MSDPSTPLEPCIGNDPCCPCADGLWCHYVDDPETGTKGWPIPEPPTDARVPDGQGGAGLEAEAALTEEATRG